MNRSYESLVSTFVHRNRWDESAGTWPWGVYMWVAEKNRMLTGESQRVSKGQRGLMELGQPEWSERL